MPPKVIAKNADRQGGVLPVSAANRTAPAKPPAAKLKLEVRRLPPGLTLEELDQTLGEEWKDGNGKVDWRDYRQGKTRPPGSGKLPEQSRYYLHLISEAHVKEFERRFLDVVFHDKAGTYKSPDLKNLQPTLGYAPNQRTPLQQSKKRADNRQGTIDQDPEFISFLEAETQPITKAAALDSTNHEVSVEKTDVKTTPLIEDLRERKANKAKAAQAKADKAAEKEKKAQASKNSGKDSEKDGGKGAQQKADQAGKDGAKAQGKTAAKQKQAQPEKVASPAKSKKPPPSPKPQNPAPSAVAPGSGPPSPAPNRGPRQRGNADGIKKMLQKDLGIKPKQTPPTEGAASTTQTAASSAASTQTEKATATPTESKSPAPKSTPTAPPPEPKPLPLKAYLKHANPSQGMTEILIQAALSQYGEVSNVTIDPRKGTAIALFKQNEGLKKALEAKKVPVANGAVEVLEFRDRSGGGANRGGFRGGRGGRGGARGGASNASSAAASPAPASAT